MALPALKEAFENHLALSSKPALEPVSPTWSPDEARKRIAEQGERFARVRRESKVRTIVFQKGFAKDVADIMRTADHNIRTATLAFLETAARETGQAAEQIKRGVKEYEEQADGIAERTQRVSQEHGRFYRRNLKRFIGEGYEWYNDVVEFYYFLLSLRAEYDPDARGGKSFDNPEQLRAYLENLA